MRLTQRDAAAIIGALERIDEERQRILDILYPETDDAELETCPHPREQLEDQSTLGTELYHCRACGESFDHDPSLT